MNRKFNFLLSFDPDAWELSVVAHRPGACLPELESIRVRRESAALANTLGARLLLAPRRARR